MDLGVLIRLSNIKLYQSVIHVIIAKKIFFKNKVKNSIILKICKRERYNLFVYFILISLPIYLFVPRKK